jgi:hypothetical protein
VVFQLDFSIEDGLRSPTDEETNNLLCRTNRFFANLMKGKTGEDIETYGFLLEVKYDESAFPYPISIVFASNTTYAASGEPLSPQVVKDAMDVTTDEILVYITGYVSDTSEDDVFFNTLAVSFNFEVRDEVDGLEAQGPTTCRSSDLDDSTLNPTTGDANTTDTADPATATPTTGETTDSASNGANDTLSPTVMGATSPPTVTSQPLDGTSTPTLVTISSTSTPTNDLITSTISPTANVPEQPAGVATDSPTAKATEQPSDNGGGALTDRPTARATQQPSIGGDASTNLPTAKATEQPIATGVTGQPTAPPPTSFPISGSTPTMMPSSSPSAWTRYTNAPVTEPVEPPPTGQHLSTGLFPVRTTFLISNLAGLSDENTIRFSSGLDVAWSTFATEMVLNVTRDWIASGQGSNRRRQLSEQPRYTNHKSRRSLSINRVPNSAKVTKIKPVPCGPTDHLDATCLTTQAEYMYSIEKEYFFVLNQTFYNETNKALWNGTFQFILDHESPGTPLVIGNIQREAFREYADSGGGDSGDGGGGGMSGGAKFCIVMLIFALIGVPLYILYRKRKEDADKSPSYDDEGFAYDFLIPSNAKIQTEVDDFERRRKTMGGVDVNEEFSTTSSEEGPAGESQSTAEDDNQVNGVEEDEGDIEVQAPEWWGNESANLGNDDIFENEEDGKSRNTTVPAGVGDNEQVVLNPSDGVFEHEGPSTSNATGGTGSKDMRHGAAPSAGNVSGPYGDPDSKFGMSMREAYGDQDSKFGMSMREPYGDQDSKFGMSMREPYGEQEDKFGMSMRAPFAPDRRAAPMYEDVITWKRNEERDSAPGLGSTSRTASTEAPIGPQGYQAGGRTERARSDLGRLR